MKIVIAAWHLKNFNVGIGRYARELIEALGRVDQTNYYDILLPQADHPFTARPNMRYRVIRFPFFRRRFWEQVSPLMVGAYDVLHFPYDSCVAWKRGKFVTTIHDVKPLLFPELRPRTNLNSRIEDWLVGDRWQMIDQVITVSEHSRRDVLAHVPLRPDQVSVTPLGLDAERFRPAEQRHEGRPYVLCVAGSDPTKNVGVLIEAFAALPSELRHRFDLVLAGDVCKREDIRAAIARTGLSAQSKLVGLLSDEALVTYYQQATVFVFPSLYEGFGLPVLEAMGCGCPVICSNAASLPEVAGEAAILVDPRRADQLAQELARVLESTDVQASLRARALARSKEYVWERTARQTVAVYERTVSRSGRAARRYQ
ncbi:MAG: putative Phosphatidylinositol N-acetylglucosaminyltransferase [Nitrospira sp.]|nr:MAG: putative Phosphatidylinositol N-acetylglucosaminyltransferase [Nitrospira sp.]